MIDRLVHGLAMGSGLTAEEILDVLWISAIYSSAQASEQGTARSEAEASMSQDSSEPGTGDSPFTSSPAPAPPGQDRDGVPLRLSGSRPGDGRGAGEPVPATEVGFGSPRPIRNALAMPKALRRLRQVRAPSRYLTVDIDATVEATAEAGGRLLPRFTRSLERALDLVLVVDGSVSMSIWDDTFEEFERLLVQTGAFRSVSRLKLLVQDRTVVLADPSGRSHPPRRLIDPSGRRLILVATDASTESWYTRAPWDTIASWCEAMPVALIQVLPKGYWAGTALGEPYVTTQALRPASPNCEYARRLAWWAQDPGGLPLPVVTLAPEALETWALAAVSGTAWATGITATPPDPEYAPSVAFAEAEAEAVVNDFLSKASPGAERLARVLASAPALSIPLISVLQESLAPETGVLELAEILSGSLLENTSSSAGQQLFRFRPGTREILQRGVTTFEEWDAYAVVSKYLHEHHRLGGPLRVLFPDAEGSSTLDPADDPFSELHETLVIRLGLRTALGQQPSPEPLTEPEPEAALERADQAMVTGAYSAVEATLQGQAEATSELSPLLAFHLERCDYWGVRAESLARREFTEDDLKWLDDLVTGRGRQRVLGKNRPRERAEANLSAARIMQDLGRTDDDFRSRLRDFAAAMGDACVVDAKGNADVIRAYYSEAVSVKGDWSDTVGIKLRQLVMSFVVNDVRLLEIQKLPDLESALATVMKAKHLTQQAPHHAPRPADTRGDHQPAYPADLERPDHPADLPEGARQPPQAADTTRRPAELHRGMARCGRTGPQPPEDLPPDHHAVGIQPCPPRARPAQRPAQAHLPGGKRPRVSN